MSILIAYATKNKTTELCAKMLAEKLSDAEIFNLSRNKVDISPYDTIVIGSCIRFNYIHNDVKEFVRDNLDELMKKNVAIYVCCGFPEKANQYVLHNFPKKLLNKSLSVQCFGGSFNVAPLRLFDKFVIKIVSKNYKKAKRALPQIDKDTIITMAKDIAPTK